MLKNDIIKVISNLAFHYPSCRDNFKDAIPHILSNCLVDDMNPCTFYDNLDIRETSLFCIRNLTTDNRENQDLIASLEAREVAKSTVLEDLGLEATLGSSNKVTVSKAIL